MDSEKPPWNLFHRTCPPKTLPKARSEGALSDSALKAGDSGRRAASCAGVKHMVEHLGCRSRSRWRVSYPGKVERFLFVEAFLEIGDTPTKQGPR